MGSSNDEDMVGDELQIAEVLRGVNDISPFSLPVLISREHNALPLGERFADGVPGFSAHDDGVTCGVASEEFEVFGEMPREASVLSYNSVGGHGDDSSEFHNRVVGAKLNSGGTERMRTFALDAHFGFNVWIRIIVPQFEVITGKLIDIGDFRVDPHCR